LDWSSAGLKNIFWAEKPLLGSENIFWAAKPLPACKTCCGLENLFCAQKLFGAQKALPG
jgi:hypothetical protein